MKPLLFLFLFLSTVVRLCSDEDDPSLFHHVNVISGHLNLRFDDIEAEGAIPLSISRTYSSAGALERSHQNMNMDLVLKAFRKGWMFQGGWNFCSHTNLLIEPARDSKKFKIYLPEPNGNPISYSYSHADKKNHDILYFKPQSRIHLTAQISGKNNPQNNLIYLNLEQGEAIVHLPDGGTRIYRGKRLHKLKEDEFQCMKYYYLLERENLPSKHAVYYFYDENANLTKIEIRNPSGKKVFSSISFETGSKENGFCLKAKTSNNKVFSYKTFNFEKREYIDEVISNCQLHEKAQFSPGRRESGARMTTFTIAGKPRFTVDYYTVHDKKTQIEWVNKPHKIPFHIDKVASLKAPMGPNGEEITVAKFSYVPNLTEARDSENLLTRYHHDGEKLIKVEAFDQSEKLRSFQKFYWQDSKLCCKAMFDAKGQVLFAKTFVYDEFGNVIEEKFWGQLTGQESSRLVIDDKGNPSGGESYRKKYAYLKKFNLPILEDEEDGVSYEYKYIPDTNLLAAKFTKYNHRILCREFYFYDENHLLVHEIVDNGSSAEDANNVIDVTHRLQKRYIRSSDNCLPETLIESYFDLKSYSEKLLRMTKLTYNNGQITKEDVYDAKGNYRYSIQTEYDDFGQIIRKTNPLGQENRYHFNHLKQPDWVKEIGSPQKIYQYDAAGRQISCHEVENEKETTLSYDKCGRLLAETDSKGNTTNHSYDCFGNRISTQFPVTRVNNASHEATVFFEYDVHGNLISTKMPQGELTLTFYNSFRKPTKIIQPDKNEVQHFYYKNGTLAKIIYPDLTQVNYQYDPFKRITSKIIISAKEEILSAEFWTYNAFQMLSYTDSRGLITTYEYDGAGRKIAETACGRTITYSYDNLGFLEKTDNGITSFIQKHDVAGRIIEQYEQDKCDRIENRMKFFYDEENRKIKAIRSTSQGDAVDTFAYKYGKLERHQDPTGAVTLFIYDEKFTNDLGQKVLQKTMIDPLGNISLEQEDACGKQIFHEKKDPKGETIFKEEYRYDHSGNRIQRISSVYQKSKKIRDIAISWEYDSMGHLTKQIESGRKFTSFSYDSRGRIKEKILPNGIRLQYFYDGVDRLLRLKSSDGTIDYEYQYDKGPDPSLIVDHINYTSVKKAYNLFGQILQETNPANFTLQFNYDANGRCQVLTLPDNSSLKYTFSGAHLNSVLRYSVEDKLLYQHNYSAFDQNGQVEQEELINHLGFRQTVHDLLERPSFQNSSWLTQKISYGPSGLVTSISNTLFGEKNYSYDALNQMIREGEQKYDFDSLGNSSEHEIDDCNRLLSTKDCSFTYDDNGNPQERLFPNEIVKYKYDALDRLIEIETSSKTIRYFYDPFSRLYGKKTFYPNNREETEYYLQSEDGEFGTLNDRGQILELKVLGLGIKGEIGAAIAIEKGSDVYAPLHDFMGNIIALISSDGTIKETYQMNAFGKELDIPKIPTCPWRFCSKRHDEEFVCFGLRFYDPSTGRWHTPDPSGFQDSANLYVYVLNSPLNRIDLFGLFSEPFQTPVFIFPISLQSAEKFQKCSFLENGVYVDYIISCDYWHKLNFSLKEQLAGEFNLLDHLQDFYFGNGFIQLASFENGINVSDKEFDETYRSISNRLPGTLFIGRYNKTEGFVKDSLRAIGEIAGIETSKVIGTRQFMVACADAVHKLSPATMDNVKALWLHCSHSEAGILQRRGIEGMTPDQKALMQQHLVAHAAAPGMPTPKSYAYQAVNIYSKQDCITGIFGASDIPAIIVQSFVGKRVTNSYCRNSECDIRFVPCTSTWSQRSMYFADHAFMGGTYQEEITEWFSHYHKKFGFNYEKNR